MTELKPRISFRAPDMIRRFKLKTPKVIFALILREMTTTYGRSPGGYAWAVLEPVAGIALLSLIFGLFARSPAIGTSFPLFYATGLIPFLMYMSTQNNVARSIAFSKNLLAYPRVTYFDAVIARFLLSTLIQLVVAFIVLTGIVVITSTPVFLDFGDITAALGMALMLGLGVGTLNCLLFSVFPVWSQVWGIVNRPAFLASGIFFTFDQIPDNFAQYLWFNPLIHVVGKMRQGIYPTYVGEYVSVQYVIGFAMFPMVLGFFFLRRYHKKILNEL